MNTASIAPVQASAARTSAPAGWPEVNARTASAATEIGWYVAKPCNQPGIDSGLGVIAGLLQTLTEAGIPAEKTILLGFSQGACLSLEFVARHPARYGGVAGLSGGLIGPPGTTWEQPGSLDGTPVFFPGAVVNPQGDIPELEIIKMEKKVAAGAQFFQTQAVYELESFATFMDQIKHLETKVLAGIVPLKSPRMGRFMNEKIPGIRVPDELIERLEKSSRQEEESLAIARELIAGCRDLCHGVHLMTIGWYDRVERMLTDII